MIGADNSEEMLEIAMESGLQPAPDILIFCRICGNLSFTAPSGRW